MQTLYMGLAKITELKKADISRMGLRHYYRMAGQKAKIKRWYFLWAAS
jgi:hypothetical protein